MDTIGVIGRFSLRPTWSAGVVCHDQSPAGRGYVSRIHFVGDARQYWLDSTPRVSHQEGRKAEGPVRLRAQTIPAVAELSVPITNPRFVPARYHTGWLPVPRPEHGNASALCVYAVGSCGEAYFRVACHRCSHPFGRELCCHCHRRYSPPADSSGLPVLLETPLSSITAEPFKLDVAEVTVDGVRSNCLSMETKLREAPTSVCTSIISLVGFTV